MITIIRYMEIIYNICDEVITILRSSTSLSQGGTMWSGKKVVEFFEMDECTDKLVIPK
jgi:hypothetical protein